MSNPAPDAVTRVLEQQAVTSDSANLVERTFEQNPVVIGLALVALLAYGVYHLVGSKPSDKDGASAGVNQDPLDRTRSSESGSDE